MYAQENVRETGLCPFCQGVCSCTRCLRNEKIAKFKAMYSMLGGELGTLQSKSILENIQGKSEEQLPRGRGRPKKYVVTHVSVNSTKKKLRKFGDKDDLGFTLSVKQVKQGKKGRPKCKYPAWHYESSKRKKTGGDTGSGNDTQEETVPRKKVKRGVGRPRLDKVRVS